MSDQVLINCLNGSGAWGQLNQLYNLEEPIANPDLHSSYISEQGILIFFFDGDRAFTRVTVRLDREFTAKEKADFEGCVY